MLRIICLLTVFLSCTAFGLYLKGAALYNIRLLTSFQSGLMILEREIEYALSPLSEALFKSAAGLSPGLKNAFLHIGERLKGSERRPVSEIWEEEMNALFQNCSFSREEKEIILSLGGRLGRDDYKGQLKTIENARQGISQALNARKESYGRYEKLYSRLGALVGAFIAVALI